MKCLPTRILKGLEQLTQKRGIHKVNNIKRNIYNRREKNQIHSRKLVKLQI